MGKNEIEKVYLVKTTVKCLDTQQVVAASSNEAEEKAEENIYQKMLDTNEIWEYTEVNQVAFKTDKSKRLKLISYLIQDAREV